MRMPLAVVAALRWTNPFWRAHTRSLCERGRLLQRPVQRCLFAHRLLQRMSTSCRETSAHVKSRSCVHRNHTTACSATVDGSFENDLLLHRNGGGLGPIGERQRGPVPIFVGPLADAGRHDARPREHRVDVLQTHHHRPTEDVAAAVDGFLRQLRHASARSAVGLVVRVAQPAVTATVRILRRSPSVSFVYAARIGVEKPREELVDLDTVIACLLQRPEHDLQAFLIHAGFIQESQNAAQP
mmetsp:Transcript_111378/g.314460  ORF Transcript_111378/g.314460 Transcript_111378/m.314460 type:complete len:241 (+) Transcript_111378:417-1139(+)